MVAAISVFQLLAFTPVMLQKENLGGIQQNRWWPCFWTSKRHQRTDPNKPAGRMGGMSAPLLPFLNQSCEFSFSPAVIPAFGLYAQPKQLWPGPPASKTTEICPWASPD